MDQPLVSVIVPVRNEQRFIQRCLESIRSTSYPAEKLEIILVDGMSDDGTREILTREASKDPRCLVLDNPSLTAPAALNLGIARSHGTVIMRMDAHGEYPAHYIPTLVDALKSTGADNVGGVWETVASGPSAIAKGIALALAHPAGVGGSSFRIGIRDATWVDTVPFGCWRRELFDRVGLFDESLARNQDDEFNMRVRRAGGRILLLPQVVTRYYARETLAQLWRMNFQYGFYKPLTAIRAKMRLRPYQLAPALLVVSLGACLALAAVRPSGWVALAALVGAYGLFVLAAAIPSLRTHGLRTSLAFAAAIPTMHLAYGTGFLRGTVRFAILRRDPPDASPQLSR